MENKKIYKLRELTFVVPNAGFEIKLSHFYNSIVSEYENKTIMIDKFYFESPFGIFGHLANKLFLKKRILFLN